MHNLSSLFGHYLASASNIHVYIPLFGMAPILKLLIFTLTDVCEPKRLTNESLISSADINYDDE